MISVDTLAEVLPSAHATDRSLDARAFVEALTRALATLAPAYRAVFLLREYHGLDYQEITAKSPPEDELGARRRISRERAGLDPMPSATDLARRPIIERYLRIMMRLGNDAEAAAASVLGAQRAHELRIHGGAGWNGTVADYGSCEQGK